MTGASGWSLAELLTQPEIHRALTKVQYQDTWAQSLIESHAESTARDAMLADFWKEVQLLQQVLRNLGIKADDVDKSKTVSFQWF